MHACCMFCGRRNVLGTARRRRVTHHRTAHAATRNLNSECYTIVNPPTHQYSFRTRRRAVRRPRGRMARRRWGENQYMFERKTKKKNTILLSRFPRVPNHINVQHVHIYTFIIIFLTL